MLGKIWISFERNYFYGMSHYQDMLSQILSGQEVKFGKYHTIADKYKKYKQS
jgi:hypothetical protein